MVSKASEDLPEPDRPVKTTSWSRGMATSMFLRLCSRAPRMVMARASRGGWLGRSGMPPERSKNGPVLPGQARRRLKTIRTQVKGRHKAGPAQIFQVLRLEVVVYATPNDAGLERDVGGHAACRHVAARLAEIDIEIFDLGRPGALEGVFEAAAGGPTDLGRRLRSAADRRHIDVAKGRAAGEEGQPAIHGIADAAARRCEPIVFRFATDGGGGALDPAGVDVGFRAPDPQPGLQIVTDRAAGQRAADVEVAGGAADIGPARSAKAVAAVDADIEPGPIPRCGGRGRLKGGQRHVGGIRWQRHRGSQQARVSRESETLHRVTS